MTVKRNKRLINLPLKDICPQVCGIRTYEPGECKPLHHIQRYVLHYVTQGKGRYLINGRTYEVGPGDLFIGHPGSVTMYAADAESSMTYIWVSFSCTKLFSDLLEQGLFHAPWAGEIFQQINASRQSTAVEWLVCGRLYDFFAELVSRRPAPATEKNDYVSQAVKRIRSNCAEDLQISDIAAELGLSRSYFSRIFKQHMTISPQEYLVSYRLETAALLLVEQGLSQKEAARRTGYSDICTFSRMFKRKYGISPGEYVKREQGNE